MFGSVWNWIKTTVNYYFNGNVKDELVEKINQPETTQSLSEEVKQSLLESIIQNKPREFVEKLQNDNNIPKKIQDDLILSMIRASQMYANPMTEIPTIEKSVNSCNDNTQKMKQSIYVNKNWKKSYDLVVNQIKFRSFIKEEQEKMKEKQRELCQIMYVDKLSNSHCIVVRDDREFNNKPKRKFNDRNRLNNIYNRVSYKNQRNNSKNNKVKMDCKWNQHF